MKTRVRVKNFFEFKNGVISIKPRNELENDILLLMNKTGFMSGLIDFVEEHYQDEDIQKTMRKIEAEGEAEYGELMEMLNLLITKYWNMHEDVFNTTFAMPKLLSSDETSYKKWWHTMVFIADVLMCASLQGVSHLNLSEFISDIEKNLLAI